MKTTSVIVGLAYLFLIITVVSSHVITENRCPPAEDIEPCACYIRGVLQCPNVNDVEVLRTVFRNSDGYKYILVNISSSSLRYLPHDIFNNVEIKNLVLHNMSLTLLFDLPPDGPESLENLDIQNTQVSRLRMSWDLLQCFTELKALRIHFNSIRVLGATFRHYVSKKLQELEFYGTETRGIKPGVLVDFVNLNKVSMEACQITALSRDIFPRPFNVQVLKFNDNKITNIAEDLFFDMPNLQTLDLRNNLISVIPESPFDGNIARITYVWFDGIAGASHDQSDCDLHSYLVCGVDELLDYFPGTEEELYISCKIEIKFFKCVIRTLEKCDSDSGYIDIHYLMLGAVKEMCNTDSPTHEAVLDNLACVKPIFEDGAVGCYHSYPGHRNVKKYVKALRREGIPAFTKKKGSKKECLKGLYIFSCEALKIERNCGTSALEAFIKLVFTRTMETMEDCNKKIKNHLLDIVRVIELEQLSGDYEEIDSDDEQNNEV